VFVGEHGGILRRIVLRKHWLRARTAAGLSDAFRFHDLRHTANTIAASTGASTRELMQSHGPRVAAGSPAATSTRRCERDAAIATAFEQLAGRPKRARRSRRNGPQRPQKSSSTCSRLHRPRMSSPGTA